MNIKSHFNNFESINCLGTIFSFFKHYFYISIFIFLVLTPKCVLFMCFREDLVQKVPEVKGASTGQL